MHTAHALDPVDDFIEAAAVQTLHIHRDRPVVPGDILVFMPGRYQYPPHSGRLAAETTKIGSEEIENLVALLKRVAQEILPNEMQVRLPETYRCPSGHC